MWKIYDQFQLKLILDIKLIFDVLYISKITQNMLSVAQILEKNYKILFENKLCVIKDANNI